MKRGILIVALILAGCGSGPATPETVLAEACQSLAFDICWYKLDLRGTEFKSCKVKTLRECLESGP